MHTLSKQLVAEISMTYMDERYRKYTSYLSIKGLQCINHTLSMAFLTNKPSYPMKTSPYNPKGTTAQLHEVDTGTENPKIPFYRFFLHVKFSSHFRKTKQRNEQRRPDILEVFHSA